MLKSLREIFGRDNWFGTTINQMNSTIGSGIFFLPFLLKTNGIFLGLASIVLGCLVFIFTKTVLFLSLNEARRRGIEPEKVDTLEKLGGVVYGKPMEYLIEFSIVLYLLGAVTAYQALLSDTLVDVVHNIFPNDERFDPKNRIFTLSVAFICYLLMNIVGLSEKIRNLRPISFASLVVTYSFIGFVVIFFFSFQTVPLTKGEVKFLPDFFDWKTFCYLFLYGGVVTFCFGNHTLTVIHSEFEDKNLWKIMLSIINSHLFVLVLYLFIAMFGYLSFLDGTKTSIALSYTVPDGGGSISQKWIAGFMKFLMFSQLLLTTPPKTYRLGIALHSSIQTLMNKIFVLNKENNTEKNNDHQQKRSGFFSFLTPRFVSLTVIKLVAIGICSIIAYLYPDSLGVVSYIGAGLGTIISHVIQQIIFLKFCKTTRLQKVILWMVLISIVLFLGIVPFTLRVLHDRNHF